MNLSRFITIPTLLLTFTAAVDAQQTVQPVSDDVSEVTATEKVGSSRRWAMENLFAGARAPVFASNASSTVSKTSPQTAPEDQWQFQFTPYLWIAGISGRAGVGNFNVDVNTGITDDDIHLNFGFMGTFEARKNRLVILTDLQFSNLGTDRPSPGPFFSGADADFKTFILDPEVGYRILENPEKGAFLDVLGGIRYWHLRSDLTFNAGLLPGRTITESRDWVDGVAGLRGKAHLSPRLFLTGKGDLGGGGSNFTYQLFGGVGLLVGTRYALIGGYRYLNVNYNKNDFLFDMALHGPVLGLGIRF
jgi:hypothetical protein